MKGKVRTKQKCVKCNGKYEEGIILNQADLWCPKCLTHPTRYFVDICWKRQYKLYSDQNGRILGSYELASRLLNEIRQKIDKHTFDPKDYITSTIKPLQFETNIYEWLQRQQKRLDLDDIAPSYYEKIEHITKNYFIPYFLKRDVRDIRTADIQDFQLSLPAKLKPKTQLNIMSLLHKYFRDLYDREEIKRMPKFKRIEVPDPHWNWVDVEEQEAIFIHIPEKHKPIFTFMMFQGCRPGEARALWREDINFNEGTAIIRRSFSNDVYRKTTKTKRERLIPLHVEVLAMLKKLPILKGFIFIDSTTGKRYRKYKLNRIFDRARRLAGIENLTLYQWSKHSFCSQAINRGVPHKLVNEMVGTKSERSSRRYQHVNVTGLKLTLRPKAKILEMEGRKDKRNKE
ncbi:MAG: tyrosine-type recombinase/integrase [bacterium]